MFEIERKIYEVTRMRWLAAYPPSVHVLLSQGQLWGIFPTREAAIESASTRPFAPYLIKQLGDVENEVAVTSP